MQPTEQTPSTDVRQLDDRAQDTESSDETEERSSSSSWWHRITGRLFGEGAEDEPSDEEAQQNPDQSTVRTLTEEEFQKSVQAEVDRRESKRQREVEAAERKRLRDEDPWQYAEVERSAEAAAEQDQRLTEVFQGLAQAHDQITLVPLMQSLPDAEQQRLMALPDAGVGVDGRRLLTTEALKSLEKHWRAEGAKDAEAKLRRNTSFRKQVLSEFQGGAPEPELLPTGSARANGTSSEQINDLLRRQIGVHRQA